MVPFWFFVLGFTSAALAACVYALCVSAKTAQLLTENDWMRARLADLEDDSVIRVERDSKGRFVKQAGAR